MKTIKKNYKNIMILVLVLTNIILAAQLRRYTANGSVSNTPLGVVYDMSAPSPTIAPVTSNRVNGGIEDTPYHNYNIVYDTPFYRIYEHPDYFSTDYYSGVGSLGSYYYEIGGRGDSIIAGADDKGPIIDTLSWWVCKLEINHGSNFYSLTYIDLWRKKVSESLDLFTIHADYIDSEQDGDALVAYFDYDPDTKNTVLIIKNIFDDAFKVTIGRDFLPPMAARTMIFLNENELYLRYYKAMGKDYDYVEETEIIKFR